MAQTYQNIYILGTHKLAQSYYDKITQANKENRIGYNTIKLINPNTQSYADFILTRTIPRTPKTTHRKPNPDIIIPDHTAKHFMLEVFFKIAKDHDPKPKPITLPIKTPYLKKLEKSIWALSYATWTCPLYCDEPETCPHTKEQRTWTLHDLLKNQKHLYRFTCMPLIDEIVYIPMNEVVRQIRTVQIDLKEKTIKDIYVFTHSNCHGILGMFSLTTND